MSTETDQLAQEAQRENAGSASGIRNNARAPIFGIRAKLFLAFAALAALTLAATVVSWSVFKNVDHSVTRVTKASVPSMVSSLRLAELSAEIAATAPAIMASRSQEERVREQVNLNDRAQMLSALVEELSVLEADPAVLTSLSDHAKELSRQLSALNDAVSLRLDLAAQLEASLGRLSQARIRFLETLEPLVDDSFFDLVISSEKVTAESTRSINGLVDGGVSNLDQLLTINAEGNLAAGLLAEALHLDSTAQLQPVRERFLAAAAAVERDLRKIPESSRKPVLRQTASALLAAGQGKDNVFDLRERELRAGDRNSDSLVLEQERRISELKMAHDEFLLALAPMIDDAAFDLVLSTEDVTRKSTAAIRDLIDVGANALHVLLTVRAEGNLVAGLLSEAAGTTDPSLLLPLRERFVAAKDQMDRMLKQVPASLDGQDLREVTASLIELGQADDGIFALRRNELGQAQAAEKALESSRNVAVKLGDKVAELVKAASKESNSAAADSEGAIESGKLWMLLFTASSLLGACVVVFFYVGPQVVRPLDNITKAMSELAAGDTSVDIPSRDRQDELGRMAQALGVFRDTAIEVQRSNLKEIHETRRRLTDAIESISEAFSLYDPEDRLVICNSKYRSLLYPEIAKEIRPGMTFEEIVRQAAERGYIKDAEGRIEEWLAERLARHRDPGGPHIQERGDGRWIMVSERKTDEGGIVAVYSDITELKQREAELAKKSSALEQLSGQLAKYLSPQVYESIFTGKQEVTLESRRKKLTVFFSDIAGFTETADRLESEDLTQLLNHYLTEMAQIALAHGATIDKFVGDAIVIFFGDPETKGVKEDALACVKMAIAMRRRLAELHTVWRDAGIEKPLVCRIGINTGFCTVGNFGSEDRMDYTIVGGGVNLASRLESAATPGEILISYETYALVKDEILCEERDRITVKGIAYPVATYQVVDSYDSQDRRRYLVREEHPNLKLDMDLGAMSDEERDYAESILRRAIKQLHSAGSSGTKRS
jgi:class 3 adenylate cyclase/phosphoglycerate-specific signal transduction histidine kinase